MKDSELIENIINKYFKEDNVLTNHQIESYNDFIDNILPKIISQYFPLDLEFNDNTKDSSKIKHIRINVENVSIETPQYTENNTSISG